MRAVPPQSLVDLLERLQLASPAQVRAVHRHAARLAKDLTLFESVWVDALVQARLLTPFQAGRINAGQGESLRVGPYLLQSRLNTSGFAQGYLARKINTRTTTRLIVLPVTDTYGNMVAGIERLIERTRPLQGISYFVLPQSCGVDGGQVWINAAAFAGQTLAHWLTRGGRLPPLVVLEIARQMVAALAVAEGAAIVHGDISVSQVALDPLGTVQLLDPGLRPQLRPTESDPAGLSPTSCDSLAPEQISDGVCAGVATDLYSCGILWWQLLAGRSPLTGATLQARRSSASAGRVPAIGPIAPDSPRVLVEAVMQCTEHAVERRPSGFAELLERLGPPSDRGQRLVAQFVAQGVSPPELLARRIRTLRRSPDLPTWSAATTGVALALVIGSWPLWLRTFVEEPAPQIVAAATTVNSVPALKEPDDSTADASQRSAIAPTPARDTSTVVGARTPPRAAVPEAANGRTAVVRTTALEPLATAERKIVAREFVLSATRPIAWTQLRLSSGQVVRSRPGERARIVVPPGSMLAIEGVSFEDVDFLMPQHSAAASHALEITARQVSFTRCSFQTRAAGGSSLTAIAWSATEQQTSMAACALRHCVLSGFDIGVRCQGTGAASLALTEVLFLGPGVLVSADTSPTTAKLALQLARCTVRSARGVVELRLHETGAAPVRIVANDGVFSVTDEGAVLSLRGSTRPQEMLQAIDWHGQGCVVEPRTAIVRCFADDDRPRIVNDAKLPIDGLVRSKLGFAGPADAGPEASRLIQWQVPLRSGLPPGIGDEPLFLPAWPE